MSYYHSRFSPFWGDDDAVTVNDDSFWRLPFNPEWKPSFEGERQRVLCNSDIFDFDPECEPELYNRRMDPLGCSMWSERHEWLTLDSVRQEFFRLIDRHPRIDWILTTKRPENVLKMWNFVPGELTVKFADGRLANPHDHKRNNVWLGAHIEDQATADARVPDLLQWRDLVPVLFGDVVPMGEVDLCLGRCWNCLGEGNVYGNYFSDDGLGPCYDCEGTGEVHPDSQLDWITASGQTGPNARPSHPDWFRSLRDQCKAAGVPFWFESFGSWAPAPWKVERKPGQDDEQYRAHSNRIGATHAISTSGHLHEPSRKSWSCERVASSDPFTVGSHHAAIRKVGEQRAGRLLDGIEHNGMPEVIR